MEIPGSLRAWFVAHFIVDVACAVPLLLVPEEILPLVGWKTVDPVSTRLVGAALMAIGVQSWRGRRAGVPEYRALLALKVVWSAAAIAGLTIAIGRGAPPLAFLFLAVFLAFAGVWSQYAIRLRQLAEAEARPAETETETEIETETELDPERDS